MRPGIGSLIIIVIVALLVFGPKKLPQLGKAAGSTLREFKNATKGLADDDDDEQAKNTKVDITKDETAKDTKVNITKEDVK
ncbi:preprotein translocase subunit TatA [Heyndrickxia shackletonii]|uniref:Sec-independent protein translocase protein TatA n=1 Tax=Heyndrickxia shackletonii TaxID=157838 RepID=A0A0Q3WS26_9BACI|nr:twin-arginine translocase TatA/TatE family subunit [Heyndrickxia shackletonii]KQL51029.1 preprotein translocase subunit TatA [Heyndrickxia shackletonii]MBB2481848.1 twin-arginine translocase TatA/TatE family subunit [Bacillus sp. APMAM]NEZ02039.1 twin-arginine translocase TatA/TatE family subunit [Heyndrickxia shackletonii]RTZ54777.1 twin-arginine translocase TatA/TatE family subunit [Bacillus sp. SAJ1]